MNTIHTLMIPQSLGGWGAVNTAEGEYQSVIHIINLYCHCRAAPGSICLFSGAREFSLVPAGFLTTPILQILYIYEAFLFHSLFSHNALTRAATATSGLIMG